MGKLVFDSAAFSARWPRDQTSVKNLISGTSGFGVALDNLLSPTLQAGGTMDSRLSSEDATQKSLNDRIASMDVLLNQKQETLKSQFTAMETALQASQAQGQWLAGQLASFPTVIAQNSAQPADYSGREVPPLPLRTESP